MDLEKISDSTLLSTRKVYQIDSTLYRYLYRSDSIKHPQFYFRPLYGQRKKTDLRLNYQKLVTKVYEVAGMSLQSEVIDDSYIQLTLF